MGVWLVAAAGWVFALATRRRIPALLLAAVLVQIFAYAAVYFAAYLDPSAHVRSSFFRIAAGLAPLAILGAGCVLAQWSPGKSGSSSVA